jgi:biotin-dependent carboxylase-like uncharacterized protein
MSNIFFKVLRSGINTTYQDDGRFGLQHYGVPAGGCMDTESFFLSNAIVKNKIKEGVIEFAYQGPLLELIKGKTKIAITGDVNFKIIYSDNEAIDGECNRSYNIKEGDKIDILATQKSVYGYLAVEGGFNLKPFFNSVSTLTKAHIGPNQGKKIETNDQIILNKNSNEKKNFSTNIFLNKNNTIRVLKGPQYEYFSKLSQNEFFSISYNITNLTDRMGARLKGPVIKNIVGTNIRSEGIIRGAIQVPADGQPIILLTDHPTIGGYPKIAHVISADYDLLVQKKPGTSISFKCIGLAEAEKLYKDKQDKILKIINSIRELN